MLHARHRHAQAAQVPMEPLETEKAVRVGADLELQVGHRLGCNPAGAAFVAREAFLVEHQNIGAGGLEAAGGRGAGWAAPDDDDLGAAHLVRPYVGYMYSRVSGIA